MTEHRTQLTPSAVLYLPRPAEREIFLKPPSLRHHERPRMGGTAHG